MTRMANRRQMQEKHLRGFVSRLEGRKALPKADGCEEILMPGEPEDRKTQAAMEHGISLTKEILDSLYLEALRRGVSCPEVFGDHWEVEKDSGSVVFERKE
ncbi:MAG: hypothetical protein LUE86_07835 [Clostridiales bacterium]|nr:hypothetical protein [Clostridiales bacterium]